MDTVAHGFDLIGCQEAAAAIEADLAELAHALTEAQFHAPPRTGGWSVGQCIEHLVLTGQAFLPKWDVALLEVARKPGPGAESFRYAWWEHKILQCVENPARLKSKTSAPFVPYCRRPVGETVERFLGMHQELARRLAGSRGLDARRTKVQSPFASWLRYALGFSFDLALAHERRHLSQAWRVRRQLMGHTSAALSPHGQAIHRSQRTGAEEARIP